MNWQKLSEPPLTVDIMHDSTAFAQFDWYGGLMDENTFIGVIGVIFDAAWEMANPGFSALDTCDTTPAVIGD